MQTIEVKLGIRDSIIILLAVVVLTLCVQGVIAGKYKQAMQVVQQQEQVIQQQQRGIAATNELLNRLYNTGNWNPAEFQKLGYRFAKQPSPFEQDKAGGKR